MPPCRPAVCSSSPTPASRRSTSSVRPRCSRRPTGCPARTTYEVAVAARNEGPVTSMSGLALCADRRLGALRGRFDTLVVAGGDGTVEALRDRAAHRDDRAASPARSRRVTSVCSGAFLLAEAGLLDGRRATTHWSVCHLLARLYPGRRGRPRADLRPRRQRVHVRRRDRGHGPRARPGRGRPGRDVALAVARRLVLFLRRPGNQAQFSAQLVGAARAARRRARGAALDRRPPRGRPVGRGAGGAGTDERAIVRTRGSPTKSG